VDLGTKSNRSNCIGLAIPDIAGKQIDLKNVDASPTLMRTKPTECKMSEFLKPAPKLKSSVSAFAPGTLLIAF